MIHYDRFQKTLGLAGLILDFRSMGVRKRTTEEDLTQHYDRAMEKLALQTHLFADEFSFEMAHSQLSSRRSASLVARTSRTFTFESNQAEYIPTFEHWGNQMEYRATILIPDDRSATETKALVYHNAVKYMVHAYLAESGRYIRDDGTVRQPDYSAEIREQAIVMSLTDMLLEDDKEAQFDFRWNNHVAEFGSSVKTAANYASALASGLIVGYGTMLDPMALLFLPAPSLAKEAICAAHRYTQKRALLGQERDDIPADIGTAILPNNL